MVMYKVGAISHAGHTMAYLLDLLGSPYAALMALSCVSTDMSCFLVMLALLRSVAVN